MEAGGIVGREGALEEVSLLAMKRNPERDVWYTGVEGKTDTERDDFQAECLAKMTTKMRKDPSGRTRRECLRGPAVFSACQRGCLFAGCLPAVFGSPVEAD